MVWATALALALTPVQVDYTDSGNGLLASCEKPMREFGAELCLGFISGVFEGTRALDSLHRTSTFCAPQGATMGQIKDVVLKYLRDNPAHRSYSGASLVVMALASAWPCKKS